MLGARSMPPSHGGIETAVQELSRDLAGLGHDIFIAVSESGDWSEPNIHILQARAIRTKHLHASSQALASLHFVRRVRPDIVHIHGLGPGILGPAFRALGYPVVLTVHAIDWQRAKWSTNAGRLFRLSSHLSVRAASEIIVVSGSLKKDVAAHYGRSSTMIPNGVRHESRTDDGPILAKWDVSAGNFLISAGRLVPEKGHHIVVESYSSLRPEMPLLIAGEGKGSFAENYERDLRRQAAPGIRFVGAISHGDLLVLMRNARAFLTGSMLEGLPLTVLEAMAAGTAIIASDIGPHCELLEGLGLLVKAGEPQSLSAALKELLNGTLVPPEGIKYQERVRNHYSWSEAARQTETVYRRIIDSRRPPRHGRPAP